MFVFFAVVFAIASVQLSRAISRQEEERSRRLRYQALIDEYNREILER